MVYEWSSTQAKIAGDECKRYDGRMQVVPDREVATAGASPCSTRLPFESNRALQFLSASMRVV
jgi:hypothetical protein